MSFSIFLQFSINFFARKMQRVLFRDQQKIHRTKISATRVACPLPPKGSCDFDVCKELPSVSLTRSSVQSAARAPPPESTTSLPAPCEGFSRNQLRRMIPPMSRSRNRLSRSKARGEEMEALG